MALFKKRKKESVAIPFLISMVITLLVIGIPVFSLYNQKVNKNMERDRIIYPLPIENLS